MALDATAVEEKNSQPKTFPSKPAELPTNLTLFYSHAKSPLARYLKSRDASGGNFAIDSTASFAMPAVNSGNAIDRQLQYLTNRICSAGKENRASFVFPQSHQTYQLVLTQNRSCCAVSCCCHLPPKQHNYQTR